MLIMCSKIVRLAHPFASSDKCIKRMSKMNCSAIDCLFCGDAIVSQKRYGAAI